MTYIGRDPKNPYKQPIALSRVGKFANRRQIAGYNTEIAAKEKQLAAVVDADCKAIIQGKINKLIEARDALEATLN